MNRPVKAAFKLAGMGIVLALIAGVAAPYFSVNRYGERLRIALERALGGNRRVEIGNVHFSLFKGPGFSVDRVVIREDPALGAEPFVYIQDPGTLEITPSLWSLMGGRFVVSSIRLDGASINLSRSGPASEWGRWNFDTFMNRSIMSAAPAIHIRNSRINFKFGDVKSILYLTETDLDIVPPRAGGSGWNVSCSARPARTDRPAVGLSSFALEGRWFLNPERVDMDLETERVGLDEIAALLRGEAGGVHGFVTTRLHMAGPLNNIGIGGTIAIGDVHRWDLLPPHGEGWPLGVSGRLDLVAQTLELQSKSASDAPLPVTIRFKASDYLRQPRWDASVDWNRFPIEPFVEIARHMGSNLPSGLKLSGTMGGSLSYSDRTGFEGRLAFQDTALTIPESPPVRFEQAYLLVERGHARLSPSIVRTADGEQAGLEADYDIAKSALELAISAENLNVGALRTQVTLADVPWLEQVTSGQWSGRLIYRSASAQNGWSGRLGIKDAELAVPGMVSPLRLNSALARIDGARVVLQKMEGRLGEIGFTGEYAYDPSAARPHRLRLHAGQVDASQLEDELMPTLRRAGLLAQALGRASVPDWLKDRLLEGAIQIDSLALAGSRIDNLRARLIWNGPRVQLENLTGSLGRAALSGALSVNLRGGRPSYTMKARLHGLPWHSGTVDAEGSLATFGAGQQLLANLSSEGSFSGSGVDLPGAPSFQKLEGKYNLEWWQGAPRLRLNGVNLRTEEGVFAGRGSTQDDGRLVVLLSNGSREVRVSGTLAALRLDEAAR